MTNAAVEPFRVGIVGKSSTSRHVRECFSIRKDFRCVEPPVNESGKGADVRSSLSNAHLTDAELIYAAAGASPNDLLVHLRAGRNLIVESPWELSAQDWKRLAHEANGHHRLVTSYLPRRWDADFLRIRRVLADGRLGYLCQARYFVHETGLLGECDSKHGIMELVAPLLDQYRCLAEQNRFRQGHEPVSLAQDFASLDEKRTAFCGRWSCHLNGRDLSLMIDIQADSLAGVRSGWIVEGSQGACRDGRLFTKAVDGEIVEEPLPNPPVPQEFFFDHLVAALRGQSNDLPTPQDMIALCQQLADVNRQFPP